MMFFSIIPGFLMIAALAGGEKDPLVYNFDGHYGQIEVGGRSVGAEFHDSRPLPSRISLYYPVANSIDLSTDYWKRGESRPMAVGVKIGDGAKRWIGREPWSYRLSPHTVRFRNTDRDVAYSLGYEFCLNEPAMVLTLTLTNRSDNPLPVEVYTHLKLTLRTCQTYARKDSAWTSLDSASGTVSAVFDDSDAGRADVFVENAGEPPSGGSASARDLAITDSGTSNWLSSPLRWGPQQSPLRRTVPAAAFTYRKNVAPHDSLVIIQIIGSCKRGEFNERIPGLRSGWRAEVNGYDTFVRRKAEQEASFETGDDRLDRSAVWARGILASNQHYLDGAVVPMPCPAEYNFFFTHDLLLTDLGAVNFDLDRVRENLLYVASHAKNGIIPHAFYWRDDGFKTEYCTPDNWNHLWFILAAARYLRHSGDDSLGEILYPLLSRSLTEVLSQRRADNLMHGYRPDWWDLGHREGPRAYLTILSIRALRDFLYVSSVVGHKSEGLVEYELLADEMEKSLAGRLWDDSLNYLINYNEGRKDSHIYMGSLLGAVFGLLPPEKSTRLVGTASSRLLRSPVGIMNVAPCDFNTDSVRTFFRIVGNEAGDPYVYANGGVWPHANAWYALALNAIGETDSALNFVRNALTLDGIAASPRGLPAMYEYRYSGSDSPNFGMIDKPSFLWAAGFYLNVLYELCGFRDNEWNLSLSGHLPLKLDSVNCTYAFGRRNEWTLTGKADRLQSLSAGGRGIASLVLPLDVVSTGRCRAVYGPGGTPYIESVNAILNHVEYLPQSKTLAMSISSFRGHRIAASVITPLFLKKFLVDGKLRTSFTKSFEPDGLIRYVVRLAGADKVQSVALLFK
jgi:hypothetical protein